MESDLHQLSNDYQALKEQLKSVKQTESAYAEAIAAYRTAFQRVAKYASQLTPAQRKSSEGKRISECLRQLQHTRPIKPQYKRAFSVHLTHHIVVAIY